MMGFTVPHNIPVRFFAPICILSTILIWNGVFDASYKSDDDFTLRKVPDDSGLKWICLMLFFAGTCFFRIFEAWQLSNEVKITRVDLYFVAVLNGIAFLHYIGQFCLFNAYYDPLENDITIRRMACLGDWTSLPFFGWQVAWSRHVRRGWTVSLNWLVCIVTSLSFFLCVIHRSSFYFLLGVSVTLSCIAMYETYKLHFYRAQVTPLFYVLLFLHIFFYVTRCMDYILFDFGWIWSYMFVTSFALITALTNRLYVRILKEVNEHKY